jgi:hypothetical protein
MLVVETIGDWYVTINSPRLITRKVYGAKLVSFTEEIYNISKEKAEEIYETFRALSRETPNKIVYLVLKKTLMKPDFVRVGEDRTHLYEINLYAFSFDRDILSHLPEGWEILDGFSLANALFEVHTLIQPKLLNGFEEVIDFQFSESGVLKKLKKKLAHLSETPISFQYSEYAETILRKSDYRVYASVRTISDEVNWHKLLSLPFEGTLWIPINFSDCEGFLINKMNTAVPYIAEEYKNILELYRQGEPLFLSGAILITKERLTDAIKGEIFNTIGYGAFETAKYRTVYIEETPLKFIYEGHLFLHTPERLQSLIISGFRKTAEPASEIVEGGIRIALPALFGVDRFGGKVKYSNYDREIENVENPHIAAVAPSGSGKSFKLQQFVAEWLKLTPEDLENLFKGETFSGKYTTNIQIRYFDKGYSAYKLFKLLQVRGFDVNIFATNPEEVFFNPLEFGEEFALRFTNVLLEALGVEEIKSEEAKYFRDVYKKLEKADWVCKSWKVKNLPPHLSALKEYILNELGRKAENLTLCEVAYHLKNTSFCKPIYSDLLALIIREKGSERYTVSEKKVWESLERKIRLILQTNFNAPTKVSLEDTRLFFMDIEELSKWQFFPALMLGLLTVLLERDKKKSFEKGNLVTYYVFDEVQNLLTMDKGSGDFKQYKAVASVMETLLREARKYKISVVLATQDWKVFSPQLLQNIATKIVIAGAEKKKEEVLSLMESYKEVFGESLFKAFKKVYRAAPYRIATVIAPRGIFTINPPVSPLVTDLFSSTIQKLETPDGISLGIVKSS